MVQFDFLRIKRSSSNSSGPKFSGIGSTRFEIYKGEGEFKIAFKIAIFKIIKKVNHFIDLANSLPK